jgi:Tol biopolymer transport system component
LLPFSRRRFLALAAAGRLSPPEWRRYADPATELEVVLLTDPAFASGMTAPHLRQFTRRGDAFLYWSERYSAESPGARQAFLLDMKQGESRQLTQAVALDPSSLCLTPDERSFVFFDGRSLNESPLANVQPRRIHLVPENAVRTGLTMAVDGAIIFAERENGKSRVVSVLRQQSRRIFETDQEIDELIARPRHAQLLYRGGGQFWLVNGDGSGKRQLKTEPGQIGSALWIPSGRTLLYLHIPDDAKELITLREHAPDDGTDKLLAKTSQFISVSPNADASVFTGASRSKATAYVLILLRVVRRELTLCEHRASDPAMVKPLFSPDSQSILFTSDRHGKPALYQVHVAGFVEETSAEAQ